MKSYNETFLFCFIYRPSNLVYVLDRFEKTIEKNIDRYWNEIIFTWSFQSKYVGIYNWFIWTTFTTTRISNVIEKPIHFTTDTKTCIDLILTNDTNKVKNFIIDEPICCTHSPVSIEILLSTCKQQNSLNIRNYNMAN